MRVKILLFVLAVLLGCATGCVGQKNGGLPKGRIAMRARTLDGGSFTLGGLRGKVVLVTVITTWADTAMIEIPMLKQLSVREKERLEIVCIALDKDANMVRIFKETFGIPYRLGLVSDPARFTSKEGPFGPISVMPTSILLDKEGRIAARMDGTWSPKVLEKALAKLL